MKALNLRYGRSTVPLPQHTAYHNPAARRLMSTGTYCNLTISQTLKALQWAHTKNAASAAGR